MRRERPDVVGSCSARYAKFAGLFCRLPDVPSCADIPFELSAEYLPAAKEIGSTKLSQLAAANAPTDAAFDNIVTRNPHMQSLKAQAQTQMLIVPVFVVMILQRLRILVYSKMALTQLVT